MSQASKRNYNCFVPMCRSTTKATPSKRFISVPKNKEIRRQWWVSARRAFPLLDSDCYCCDDHFNLEEDAANYLYMKMVGGKTKLKQFVVPHKFECQGIQETHNQNTKVSSRKRKILAVLEEQENIQGEDTMQAATSTDSTKEDEAGDKEGKLTLVEWHTPTDISDLDLDLPHSSGHQLPHDNNDADDKVVSDIEKPEPKYGLRKLPHTNLGAVVTPTRINLSLQDKIDLIDQLEQGAKVTQMCTKYGIAKQTVSDIKKNKDKLRAFITQLTPLEKNLSHSSAIAVQRKHMKTGKHTQLEATLWQWYKQQVSKGASVEGKDICLAAQNIASSLNITDFKPGAGWLYGFKRRHGVTSCAVKGESGGTPQQDISPSCHPSPMASTSRNSATDASLLEAVTFFKPKEEFGSEAEEGLMVNTEDTLLAKDSLKMSERFLPLTVSSEKEGSVRRRHTNLTIKERFELITRLDSGVPMKQLSGEVGIGYSTLYNLNRNRKEHLKLYEAQKLMYAKETMPDGDNSIHDRVLMEWIRYCIKDGVELNPTKIMDEANLIHKGLNLQYKCDYSEEWLQRFQIRQGIVLNDDTPDTEATTGSEETKNLVMTQGNCNASKTQRTKLLVIVKNKLPGTLEGSESHPNTILNFHAASPNTCASLAQPTPPCNPRVEVKHTVTTTPPSAANTAKPPPNHTALAEREGGEGEGEGEGVEAGCSVDKITEDMIVVEHKEEVWVKEEMVEEGEHLATLEDVLNSEPEHSKMEAEDDYLMMEPTEDPLSLDVKEELIKDPLSTPVNRKMPTQSTGKLTEDVVRGADAINVSVMGVNAAATHSNILKTTLKMERKIVEHIKKLQAHGFSPRGWDVRRMAYKLVQQMNIKNNFDKSKELAKFDWLQDFLIRNPDLCLRKSVVSPNRKLAMDKIRVRKYFDLLEKTIIYYDLISRPGNIFTVGESALHLNPKDEDVVGCKGVNSIWSSKEGDTISVIGCCSGDGTYIPPYCIFKGKNVNGLSHGMPTGSMVVMNKKSSNVNSDIFFLWLRNQFAPRMPAGKVLLLLNGHESHYTDVEMLEFADNNNIILLSLPSHATHYQPLERTLFMSLKSNYNQACNTFIKNNPRRRIKTLHFGELFGLAWAKSATVENALAGFKVTGIIPLNRFAIPDHAYLTHPNPEQDNGSQESGDDPQHTLNGSVSRTPQVIGDHLAAPGTSSGVINADVTTPTKLVNAIPPTPTVKKNISSHSPGEAQVSKILNFDDNITMKETWPTRKETFAKSNKLRTNKSRRRTLKQKKVISKQQLVIKKKYFGTHKSTGVDTAEFHKLVAMTEAYLCKWLSRRMKENGSVSGSRLCKQARLIYAAVCKKKNITSPPSFVASNGWLANFKTRCHVQLTKSHDEVAFGDASDVESYPAIVRQIFEEGGYSYEQVYNCNATSFYWKNSPTNTHTLKTGKQTGDKKLTRHRFQVLFTCNATGSHKMKPLVIHKYRKPHTHRNQNMNLLNVYWENTSKGYMDNHLSRKWFENHFIPDARAHCRRRKLNFKVLLLIGGASGLAKYLVDLHPDVQVCFLPPNVTSRIQPLNQQLLANVKLMYHQTVHKQIEHLRVEAERDSEDSVSGAAGLTATTPSSVLAVNQFWQKFDISDAVDLMADSWSVINVPTIIHAWKPLFPHLSVDHGDTLHIIDSRALLADTVASVQCVGPEFSEVTEDSVMDIVNFDPKRNINEMFGNDSDSSSDDGEEESEVIENVTTGKLSKILADCSDMKESLQRFLHDAPELQNAVPLLDNLSEILMKVYCHKIDEKQQAVMNNFYRRRPDQANKIQSLDIPDGEESITTTNHQYSKEPDFEGFENQ